MRFAILCNGQTLNAWEAATLDGLKNLTHPPELRLAIIDGNASKLFRQPKKNNWEKLKSIGFSNLAYYFYCRHFFRPKTTETVALAPYLNGVRCESVVPESPKRGVHVFPRELISIIQEEKIDFILRFGFNILKGEILTAAKYGVWSFHHDDEEKYRGGPPAFWEIYNQDPVTGSILQRLTEKLDAGIILKKGYFKTVSYSPAQNLDQVYVETAKWPAMVCEAIEKGVFDIESLPESKTSAKIYRPPKNHHMVRLFFVLLLQKITVRLRNWFSQDIWALGIIKKPIHQVLKEGLTPPELCIEHADKNAFLADPFATWNGKQLKVYCEEFTYQSPIGRISHFSVGENEIKKGSLSPHLNFLPSLQERHHRSYPYVFHWNNETYLIPECFQSKQVELWKLSPDQEQVIEREVLIEKTQGVDPTLFFHDGLFWLALTKEDVGPNSHLFLAYSKNLKGPWEWHPLNPVKIDITGARPAGSVFTHEGKLYRPAQDCSVDYGYRVNVFEIVTLTPKKFEEKLVQTLGPLKDSHFSRGVHTLSEAGPYTIIDMKKKRPVWPVIQQHLNFRWGLRS